MTRRIVTSVFLVVVALFGAAAGFIHFKNQRKASARNEGADLAPLVRAVTAQAQDYTEMQRGFGRARPMRTATIVAEVEGVVRRVDPRLESGVVIEASTQATGTDAGEEPAMPVLVVIDDRDLDDRLERARADLAAAAAELTRLSTRKGSLRERLVVTTRELEAAQRELDRIEPLVPDTLTRSALDAQRIQVTIRERAKLLLESEIHENVDAALAAQSRLDALARGVKLAERAKTRARVPAPFAGRIEMRHVEVGERVKPGDPLFTIVDLSRMEVPVALPAGRYDEVDVGAAAILRVPEHEDALWEGTVARIAPAIDTERRIFFAYLVVEGSPGANRVTSGAHLVGEIAGRVHKNVIPIPRRAFLGERVFVAVPGPDGATSIVEERMPTVVRFLAGVGLVSEGLEAGERVLVTNLESVAGGSKVRVAPEGP